MEAGGRSLLEDVLDCDDGQVEVEWVIQEGDEAVFLVEVGGGVVEGVDFYGVDAEGFGEG